MNTETLAKMGLIAGLALVALWDRWDDGEDEDVPDEATFLALGTALLVAHRARAVGFADTALAAVLSADSGRAVPTLGLALPDGVEVSARGGLEDMLPNLVDVDAEDVREAVQVEGKSQTVAEAQKAYGEGMRTRRVPAWRRVLNSGACGLCADLAKDTLPGSAEMYTHRGCTCSQRPITNEG